MISVGGEKQRIAIARLLLKNPKIFLFDEPTSALDTATEHRISETLDRITAGHTCIYIAHRLNTITDCDLIIVLDTNGRVVQQGKHSDLVGSGGIYQQMWGEWSAQTVGGK